MRLSVFGHMEIEMNNTLAPVLAGITDNVMPRTFAQLAFDRGFQLRTENWEAADLAYIGLRRAVEARQLLGPALRELGQVLDKNSFENNVEIARQENLPFLLAGLMPYSRNALAARTDDGTLWKMVPSWTERLKVPAPVVATLSRSERAGIHFDEFWYGHEVSGPGVKRYSRRDLWGFDQAVADAASGLIQGMTRGVESVRRAARSAPDPMIIGVVRSGPWPGRSAVLARWA